MSRRLPTAPLKRFSVTGRKLWIVTGELAELARQGKANRVIDNLRDREIDDAFSAGKNARTRRVPVDRGGASELQRAAVRKIDKQQAGPRIHREVAKRVEHAVP